MTDEERAQEKLIRVAQQVNQCCDTEESVIMCPYCGGMNFPGITFCCAPLEKAIGAVLLAREKFTRDVTKHWVN